jgi:hypothetical protein
MMPFQPFFFGFACAGFGAGRRGPSCCKFDGFALVSPLVRVCGAVAANLVFGS